MKKTKKLTNIVAGAGILASSLTGCDSSEKSSHDFEPSNVVEINTLKINSPPYVVTDFDKDGKADAIHWIGFPDFIAPGYEDNFKTKLRNYSIMDSTMIEMASDLLKLSNELAYKVHIQRFKKNK